MIRNLLPSRRPFALLALTLLAILTGFQRDTAHSLAFLSRAYLPDGTLLDLVRIPGRESLTQPTKRAIAPLDLGVLPYPITEPTPGWPARPAPGPGSLDHRQAV